MCGIFGIFLKRSASLQPEQFKKAVRKLYSLSSLRGKEASGLASWRDNKLIVFKESVCVDEMLKLDDFRKIENSFNWDDNDQSSLSFMGHCRLVTNGVEFLSYNNQPVIKNKLVAVHNGIVTNHEQLWDGLKEETREYDVDTEALLALASSYLAKGLSLEASWSKAFAAIEGTANVAAFHSESDEVFLGTNNGSLYYTRDSLGEIFIFASEGYFLEELFALPELSHLASRISIKQLTPQNAIRFDRADLDVKLFSLENPDETTSQKEDCTASEIIDCATLSSPASGELRRCTKCILPETIPFIEFDEEGVCNFCRNFKRKETLGRDALMDTLVPYRKKRVGYDCLVGFSGGRDSSYGLHYIKNVLGMNPVAFTYDWGMVTDLARRNIARVCGKLGVEHIVISADIKQKRNNARRNVEAWLKQPDLGIIPLFMAGDKQFYYYANQLMKKMDIDVMIFCENGKFERSHFKSGFCGINEGARRAFNIEFWEKIKVLNYYFTRFIKNPRYLNRSVFDTAFAFYSTYVLNHDYVFLFDYIDWDEDAVVDTLVNEYGWELSSDTESTWRIGDGTASFYNHIYYTMAGFTENDTFRSNQVRYGVIDRDEALRLAIRDNNFRSESVQWYASALGFDLNEALKAINSAPKLYKGFDIEKVLGEVAR